MMSNERLTKFLNALDAVKLDYTCGYCLELCKKPVTLDSCFHIICSEHFASLSTCPTCNIPLLGCKIITDNQLEVSIDAAKQLSDMFEVYRTKTSLEGTKTESSVSNKKKLNRQNSSVSLPSTSLLDKDNNLAESCNKPNSLVKSSQPKINSGIQSTLDSSITSNVTAKINKAIEKKNIKGETALHVACRQGKINNVLELLKGGANTNTKDNAGWTPLHEVVQNGRLDLVQILLQYNTLINVPGPSNETPLHEAVRYKHTEIAVELVKNGADLNSINCKGETPLELASDNIRESLLSAAEDVIQTQGVNTTFISEQYTEFDYDNIKVYCTSKSKQVLSKIKMLCKHHSMHVEQKLTKQVTVLIVDEINGICKSSLDILHGIVYGVWILSSAWVTNSSDEKLEPFKDYEITGVGNITYNGPKNSRYNKYKQLPGLFNGCHFYFHNFNTKYEISETLVITKPILNKLIVDAGGVVLRRVPNPELIPDNEKLVPYHAKKTGKLSKCSHYIIFKDIYEPMYNMAHIKALPIGWLIECLEKYELCEPW